MNTRKKLTIIIIILLVGLFTACNKPFSEEETAAPTEIPTPTAIPTPLVAVVDDAPLSPRVLTTSPAGGQEILPNAPLEIVFDHDMEVGATSAAWQLIDAQGQAVAGDITWPSPDTIRFKPTSELESGATYTAVMTRLATSTENVQMGDDFKFTVNVLGDLEIKQVLPVDGTTEVEKMSMITVVFNHPIVPLQIAEETENLPQPLTISPAVQGKGEWINTSVYVFQPTEQLQSSTLYTVNVPAGLTDVNGATLAEGRQWSFVTTSSTVNSFQLSDWIVNPEYNYKDVPLDQEFTISFSQSMNQSATEAAFSIISQLGEPVLVDFAWNEDNTSLTITPTHNLALGTIYDFILAAAATDTGGSPLREGINWRFRTYLYPGVRNTSPMNGTTQNYFTGYVSVDFNSPMDIDSLDGKIILDPAPAGELEWTYNEWSWSMSARGLEPATTYTLQVLPGGKDIYGNAITQPYTAVFTTTNYSPQAYLEMPYSPVIFNVNGSQEFYIRYVNVPKVYLAIYRLSTTKFLSLVSGKESAYSYSPPGDDLVNYWAHENYGSMNETSLVGLQLKTNTGDALPQGFYFLTLGAWQNDTYIDYNRLVVVADSNISLKTSPTEALAWLTDLESGAPISGNSVTFYEGNFQTLATGVTDANGLAHVNLPVSEAIYDARFALVDGGQHFAVASSEWGSGVSPYDFGIWGNYYTIPNQPTTYVYTDRPLYRPGHPVSFKGIVRLNDDLAYSLPHQNSVTVEIFNYDYELIYEKDLPLSGFGTFSGELLLDENASLGEYEIRVRFAGAEDEIGRVNFSVAEYRKPEFQVGVVANHPDALPGEEFTFTAQADYFSGGVVADADVFWTLAASPYTFEPSGELSRYSFDDLERDIYYYDPYGSAAHAEIISSDVTVTNANGEAIFTVPAELSEDGNGQRFTLEATITDLAGNVVSSRASANVHQSSIYVGVRPQGYLGTANVSQTFELVAANWDEETVPNQSVDVTIVERRWNSIQVQEADGSVHWESSVEEIPVDTFKNVETDAHGYASVNFTPPNGGVFKAIATTRDSAGNKAIASAYMWVAGSGYIPWRQTDDRSLNLITDKDTYTPGETAEILITSPFQEAAYALVTVERGHIREKEVIHLTSNSTTYRLPITAEMAPNAYISVSIIKGAASDGIPDFRTGMTEIQVDSDQKALNVEINIDKEESGPGDQVTYTVHTSDNEGKPVSAEVSLALTDLATLTLADPNSAPILDFFYNPQSLGVRTSIPLNYNIEHYNEQIQEQMALGMGMGSGGGGYGKGIDAYGVLDLRENFPDTAYWAADVITDANGSATVTITLPDNLTTWRMDGRAVTVDTRVGQTTIDLVSTKPLLVRPQTPRFFVRGDAATLGTAIHNNTGKTLTVKVGLNAEGVTIQSEVMQEVQIPDGQQAYVTWDVVVNAEAERVDLIFGVEGGGYTDASRPTLATLPGGGIPVYRYEAPEAVGTAGIISEGGSRTEAISLPQSEDLSGELTVRVEPSLSEAMMDSLDYLTHYPYDCVEQTISRFLPNVLTTQALQAAGRSDPELEANLEEQINIALQRLYNWQNADGGWGWWSNQESNEITTAYAVLGLVEAGKAGYGVSSEVIMRGVEYLGANLESIQNLESPYALNRQAFMVYTLARAGQDWVMSRAVELFEQRQTMSLYARAYLAQTFSIINPGDQRIDTLISDFGNAAIMSATGTHWEEDWNDYWNWNTDIRTTAIILGALTEIDPDNALNANAVRWLMTNRSAGHWRTTQETAWALMALANWVDATGELDANYQYSIYLNQKHLGNGIANQETLGETFELEIDVADMLADEINRLAIGRDDGPGNLYYTAHLTVDLPVEELAALDRGIIISRSYYSLDDKETPINQASRGDLLMGKLTIVVTSTRRYVIINDPLPAGLEAVNQDLKTSPQESIPDDYGFEDIGLYGWGWWYFDHTELRDEKVVISADYLPAGTYTYTYLVRASTVGEFHVIPPTAQEFYFPEVYGRGAGSLFVVVE